ncbi:sigma-70 family RNA polymerase sigma factor [Marinobacter halodurans]|uniref:Sigma-70 family RNA polymerase sigma factor n=1 Tax=Marinobacter halodurans TaxID=2528979 RepID=A0ABY1ZRW3_9GAMM|nr:sigma-70 family RNA polymerase sigma factor [Marinobacter halodurans]TBW59029.1 sigma-70 family RNA polymerase sigma factor [Marinobacter halodurans]
MHHQLTQLLPGLRRFAFSLTGSRLEADDLLQGTVERLLRRGPPEGVGFEPWAFRVCRNLWIDECRAHRVRRDAARQPELSEGQVVDGERALASQVELDQVDAAMAKLPEGQREIIAMVAVQGMSYQAVSESLEIPRGTVMSRLARARAALSAMLHTESARTQA